MFPQTFYFLSHIESANKIISRANVAKDAKRPSERRTRETVMNKQDEELTESLKGKGHDENGKE